MPSSPKSQWIKHTFGGGWAPAEPPTLLTPPDAQGFENIDYLVEAKNVVYELDGGFETAWGTTALMSALSETVANIKFIYDFWRGVGGGSTQQHRMLFLDDAVYKDDADESFLAIGTGLTADAVPHISQFDDLAIIANDATGTANGPFSWDGTTFQALAGSPPAFSFSAVHSGHMFAAGVHSAPSTLYYSAPFDPEDWTTGPSGSIQIDPDDGDQITGLISYKGKLIIFKGPYKGSIHVLSGTSESDFSLTPLQRGVGAVWQNSVFRYGDDVGFLWSDGHFYSLAATDATGGFRQASQLTRQLEPFLTGRVNFNKLRHVTVAVHEGLGVWQATMPIDSSSQPNFILHADYRFGRLPRFSGWFDYDGYTCVAIVRDPDKNAQPAFLYGGNDKILWKGQQSTRTQKGNEITATVQTPHLDYGVPWFLKTLKAFGIGIEPKSADDFTVGWTRDDNAEQTVTLTQAGSDVLAPWPSSQFTLGTSTLGGSRFVNIWRELHNSGEFRSVAYRFTSAEGDLKMHNFLAWMHVGSESLEN